MVISKKISLLLILLFSSAYGLNIYGFSGEVPNSILKQFTQETGIKVNFTTYDSNEILYTKLKSSRADQYDLIMPSSYYVERLARQGLLKPLDKSRLKGLENIKPIFKNPIYDPEDKYSLPFVWSVTGVFVNTRHHDPKLIKHWRDLWGKKYRRDLLILDDLREVFSIALLKLGISPNTSDPTAIMLAYKTLRKLGPNIKLFTQDNMASILIDADATIGMAWHSDIYRASQENPDLAVVYPNPGVIGLVDTFAILTHAKNLDEAYEFLNYLLRPEIATKLVNLTGFPSVLDLKATPPQLDPGPEVMKKLIFQTDISDLALRQYATYWQRFKISVE